MEKQWLSEIMKWNFLWKQEDDDLNSEIIWWKFSEIIVENHIVKLFIEEQVELWFSDIRMYGNVY